MIYKYTYKLGLDDIYSDCSAKIQPIMRMLENVACFHSDYVGQGINDIGKTGKAWALLDWEIHINAIPKYGDTLDIHTWGRKPNRLYVYRDFEIYVNDVLYIQATSRWFILDLKKRQPVRITDDDMTPFEPEEKTTLGVEEIKKLYPLKESDSCVEYSVRKSDIDMLLHVHNVNYLNMIFDMIDDDIIKSLSYLKISFKKEITLGDTVAVKLKSPASDAEPYLFSIDSLDGKTIHALAELR